jgi:hypothetical protein
MNRGGKTNNQHSTTKGYTKMPHVLNNPPGRTIEVCQCTEKPHVGQCRKASRKTWATFFAAHGINSGPKRLA